MMLFSVRTPSKTLVVGAGCIRSLNKVLYNLLPNLILDIYNRIMHKCILTFSHNMFYKHYYILCENYIIKNNS